MDNLLQIADLHVVVKDKPILKGLNLTMRKGEIHAIMGPNGAGKSTLARVLAGDPFYEVVSGSCLFEGVDLFSLTPEERVHRGLFMGFQYPIEIPGISNQEFLHAVYNAKRAASGQAIVSQEEFQPLLREKMALIDLSENFRERAVNEGFSGGEKKRNEILQMAILEPTLAVLDETDSGLDIDAMRVVARGVSALKQKEHGLLLITHYQRLLDYIHPDVVHVLVDGKIAKSGGADLSRLLEEKGYDWV